MGATLHYTDMMKFFKILFLWNPWSDFEIISERCSLGDPFQNLFVEFWFYQETLALVDGGYLLFY